MLTLDAREYLLASEPLNIKNALTQKPAILLTGAHHSRELASIQMPLYSLLKLLHGMVHQQRETMNLLIQNKYYFIPIVNVDGVAEIEEHYKATGKFLEKRKNMNPKYKGACEGHEEYGVDLNRNYGVAWTTPGGSESDPCAGNFKGEYPFSEPET